MCHSSLQVTRHGRLRWRSIFKPEATRAAPAPVQAAADLPIKLEIASGTGDWVVAQAQADVGKAAWAALELRHDRVYGIFSRMVLKQVPNLCVIGGDAGAALHLDCCALVTRLLALFGFRPHAPRPLHRADCDPL